jgi:F-type H+-transporting ATPase subunit b
LEILKQLAEQLGIQPELVVVNIIGFLILVALLKKYLYRPIMEIIESRQKEVADTYSAAERERDAMEELRRDYEKRLSGIEAEAREKIQAAIKEAQAARDEIIADARERAEALLRRGEEELAREREKAIVELREEVANLIISASSKLIEKEMNDDAHRRLVDEFISNLESGK